MTQWNSEDIEAAKLKGQQIAEAVLLEMQSEGEILPKKKVDDILVPVFEESPSSTLANQTGLYKSLTFIAR
jgi:hypothetical protein